MFSGMSKKFTFDPHAFGGLDMSVFKKTAKKVFSTAKKITLAPNRKAFLLLIQTNVFKLAFHLYKSLHSNKRNSLLKMWSKLGGNPITFEKIVTKAYTKYAKRKKILGKEIKQLELAQPNIISGPEAFIAAAAPILAALAKFFPEGSKAQQIAEGASNLAEGAQSFKQTQTNEG